MVPHAQLLFAPLKNWKVSVILSWGCGEEWSVVLKRLQNPSSLQNGSNQQRDCQLLYTNKRNFQEAFFIIICFSHTLATNTCVSSKTLKLTWALSRCCFSFSKIDDWSSSSALIAINIAQDRDTGGGTDPRIWMRFAILIANRSTTKHKFPWMNLAVCCSRRTKSVLLRAKYSFHKTVTSSSSLDKVGKKWKSEEKRIFWWLAEIPNILLSFLEADKI